MLPSTVHEDADDNHEEKTRALLSTYTVYVLCSVVARAFVVIDC